MLLFAKKHILHHVNKAFGPCCTFKEDGGWVLLAIISAPATAPFLMTLSVSGCVRLLGCSDCRRWESARGDQFPCLFPVAVLFGLRSFLHGLHPSLCDCFFNALPSRQPIAIVTLAAQAQHPSCSLSQNGP